MKEYDFNELQQMQERALERVRDMQTKAQKVAEVAQRDLDEKLKKSEPNGIVSSLKNAIQSAPAENHIQMPVELPDDKPYSSFKEYFEPENKRISQEKTKTVKADLLDTVLNEPDKALLFALLLLLRSDGADEELLMALMYIML